MLSDSQVFGQRSPTPIADDNHRVFCIGRFKLGWVMNDELAEVEQYGILVYRYLKWPVCQILLLNLAAGLCGCLIIHRGCRSARQELYNDEKSNNNNKKDNSYNLQHFLHAASVFYASTRYLTHTASPRRTQNHSVHAPVPSAPPGIGCRAEVVIHRTTFKVLRPGEELLYFCNGPEGIWGVLVTPHHTPLWIREDYLLHSSMF